MNLSKLLIFLAPEKDNVDTRKPSKVRKQMFLKNVINAPDSRNNAPNNRKDSPDNRTLPQKMSRDKTKESMNNDPNNRKDEA